MSTARAQASGPASPSRRRVSPLAATAAAIAIAALAGWLWLPWLDAPPMNPDESQYAAHASYALGRDKSAFASPVSPVPTVLVYEAAARLTAPWRLEPPRLLVVGIAALMAFGVFLEATRVAPAWLALLFALGFLAGTLPFEGLSANREWFAGPAVYLAMLAYLRAIETSPPWPRLLLAGFLLGIGVVFKDQAAVFGLALAADLFLRALRPLRPLWLVASGGAIAAGALVAVGCYFLPFLAHGTLGEHLGALFGYQVRYATAHSREADIATLAGVYWQRFYAGLPFRRLFVAAYAAALAGVFAAAWRILRGLPVDGPPASARFRVHSLFLVAALVGIQTGQRFFLHYYLFCLPYLFLVLADGWALVEKKSDARVWTSVVLSAMLAGYVFDAAAIPNPIAGQGLSAGGTTGFIIAAGSIGLVGLVALLGHGRWTPRFHHGVVIVAQTLLVCELLGLVVQTARAPAFAAAASLDAYACPNLTAYLEEHGSQGDRLFVWGWRPEIYSHARLEAATRFPIVSLIETLEAPNDAPLQGPKYHPERLEAILEDLDDRPPRWIVDAWLPSVNGGRYRMEFCPPLAERLAKDYRRVGTFDGCDLYERFPASGESESAESRRRRHLKEIEKAVRERPQDVTLRLAQADLLAQEGQWTAALAAYQAIREQAPSWIILHDRIASLERFMKGTPPRSARSTGSPPGDEARDDSKR